LNEKHSRRDDFNITFQMFKILSFIIDLVVLLVFWGLFRFFVNVKVN
jgi:hypothetical protein